MHRAVNSGAWLSAHLFFEGDVYSTRCDNVLTNIVEPFVARATDIDLLQKWFFIRYRELGPHIRLRLQPRTSAGETDLAALLVDFVRAINPQIRVTEGGVDPAPTAGDAPFGLAWIPYEPEYLRYGGVREMEIAEDLFYHSSVAALETVRSTADDRSARLGRALLTTVVMMHSLLSTRQECRVFAAWYAEQYLGRLIHQNGDAIRQEIEASFSHQSMQLTTYVAEAIRRLDAGEDMPLDLRSVRDYATAANRRLRDLRSASAASSLDAAPTRNAARSIVPSYIHMTNNRLGIRVEEEAYLSLLIARSFATIERNTSQRMETAL